MDPKKILGVGNDATPAEIQKAYRRQARKHHPDHGGDAWAFQQVQDAYEQLKNPGNPHKPKPPQTQKPSASATRPTQRARPGSEGTRRSSGHSQSSKTRPNQDRPKAKRSRHERGKSGRRAGSSRRKTNGKLPWKKLFGKDLPLQTETSVFILLNCLDVFMTYILLTKPAAFESNPVANYFLQNFGFNGMVAFKLVIVALVCVIAQIAALKKLRLGQLLLIAGSTVVGLVVLYSARLYVAHFM